jgi:hypothetical protein
VRQLLGVDLPLCQQDDRCDDPTGGLGDCDIERCAQLTVEEANAKTRASSAGGRARMLRQMPREGRRGRLGRARTKYPPWSPSEKIVCPGADAHPPCGWLWDCIGVVPAPR